MNARVMLAAATIFASSRAGSRNLGGGAADDL
jgi:hypothetical protein